MTKTLTEQWREGKLPENTYYVQFICGRYGIYEFEQFKGFGFDNDVAYIKEVLVPVPSYEELERLQQQLNEYEQTIKALMVLLGYKNKDFNNKKEAIKARDFYIEKAKQRCKKIIYKLFVAYDCGVKEHPQKQMKKLGYKVIKAEPQTLGECWFFWVEDYIEPMPEYLVKSGV